MEPDDNASGSFILRLVILDNRKNVLYNGFMKLWQQLCETVNQLDPAENSVPSYKQVLKEVQELALDQAREEEQVILELLNQALCSRHRQTNTQRPGKRFRSGKRKSPLWCAPA